MSNSPALGDWLARLGEILGMQGLALDAHGSCAFTIDDSVDIVIEASAGDDMLYLYAPMLRLGPNEPESLYEDLLKRNYPGRESGGAVFAINQRDAQIVLCLSCPLDMLDETGFFVLMKDFIETATHWWEHFNAPGLAHDESTEGPPPPGIDPRLLV